MKTQYEVVIVGGGPAGIGVAIILDRLGVNNVVLERDRVGASFLHWPKEMRLITPSFPSNSFGMLDLNAIALDTSPAFSLAKEHLSGQEYAAYLTALANHFSVRVQTGTVVENVHRSGQGFNVKTNEGAISTRFIIWAAGEFFYPAIPQFPGSKLCRHISQVKTWKSFKGTRATVIGGYESGSDAAIHLSQLGKNVEVIDPQDRWGLQVSDPSVALSPFTRERLAAEMHNQRITLISGSRAVKVTKEKDGYCTWLGTGEVSISTDRPILATGFEGSTHSIPGMFAFNEQNEALLTENDESTVMPGLFLCGASVRQEGVIFCFIYKFRQRLAVVAKEIAQRLEKDVSILEIYQQKGMLLDDLSCCKDECVC